MSPASAPLPSRSLIVDALLSSSRPGPAGIGLSVEAVSVTVAPEGPVPVAVAVFSSLPASTFVWVSV
ncbi:hypothetical protein NOMA109596_06770 [Nocardioides marinus]